MKCALPGRAWLAAPVLAATLMTALPAWAETVKIAFIDPLSGSMANIGNLGYDHFRFMADRLNASGQMGDVKFEMIGLDNQTNPKESLVQLQKAIDQGATYVVQGNGSSVASALIEAIEKNNRRNPDHKVLFLNYAAVDPVLTNDKCSFWHFRFDTDSDMKMAIMTDYLVKQPDIKKVYIIGQDYSFGKAVSESARRMLKEKRPDIEIVGDELHPLGKVKDFSPYIAKMKASGAQAVITGNWGNDMTLLVKAAADAGYSVPFLTYYGGVAGAPAAIGKAGQDIVLQVSEYHNNIPDAELEALAADYKKQFNEDLYYYRVVTLMDMLAQAMKTSGSTDPEKVALALEGASEATPLGDVVMLPENHQLLQPMFVSIMTAGMPFDVEGTGLGFRTLMEIAPEATRQPTTCQMKRPG